MVAISPIDTASRPLQSRNCGPTPSSPLLASNAYMTCMAAFFATPLFLLLPISAPAQCKDQLCSSLQEILDAASIDFRGYISHTVAVPRVSTESTEVPCSSSTWANNVSMLICYAQVPLGSATNWYARAMDNLRALKPQWHFSIKTPGDNRYVDAGPFDCEPTPNEGPYLGQCPLHLEISRQGDGSAKIYLVLNSTSSPYLLRHTLLSPTPAKPSQSIPAGVSAAGTAGCDEFCQGLKKAFEARSTNFAGVPTPKLPGAKDCLTKKTSATTDSGAQFVCYWQEASPTAGETRFRDLVARLQVLVPSDWSSGQQSELDEQTGAPLTAFHASAPGNKNEIRVYLFGESVGLHILVWK